MTPASYALEDGRAIKRYLKYNDECCYLSFDTRLTPDDRNYDQFDEKQKERNMSFIPLKSLTKNNKCNGLGLL